jgi:hypothetical protein
VQNRILRSPNDLNKEEIRALYTNFNLPITEKDCGQECAQHNPSGKLFCCDICEAVPAAYQVNGIRSAEDKCWGISNLAKVTDHYRKQFVHTFDQIFALFQDEFENYALRSEEMHEEFPSKQENIPILHRDEGYLHIIPSNERILPLEAEQPPRFGAYQ